MKKIGLFLIILITIALIFNIITTQVAWIGILITLYGVFQLRQQKRGKGSFIKPKTTITIGIILSIFLGIAFSEPTETATPDEKVASEKEETAAEKEKAEAEQKKKEEAERKAQEEATAAAKLKAEEEAAAQKAAEEAAQKAEEEKQATAQTLGLIAATVSRVVDGLSP
ncbi:hypothetical protein [Robertmurraya kyonggiensis]|uniref:Uncharacterized protein n=1 Tax=Robertmurraya kyonggiensis TaxID=1037680 RepID=A0A4U1D0H1_9BACI|nr:hypothetical protein [Robertmurraya kyonggiensis]TKC14363.1 hypothetical protein FA727_21625 [Robertmurraya kyonggiensis]